MTLNSGGTLYVAFKDALRYPKAPYQWHLDWFFFQRNLEDCQRLYRDAGFDVSEMELSRDDTGIVMTFVSRQRGAVPEPHFPSRAAQRRSRSATSDNADSNG